MATYSPLGMQPLSEAYGSAVAGQAAVPITPNIGGDSVALMGTMVTLRFQTAGTGATITLDSVMQSNFGSDVNITVTLGATAVQYVQVKADSRFKQTSGNVGHLNLSYSSVATLSLEAVYTA